MTPDYKRNGTTTLFATLNTLTGEVLGSYAQRHRHHQEWLAFLRQINQSTPKDKDIHIICDNYATHKHPKGCVFQTKPATDSTAKLPPIPFESCH